MLDLLGGFHWQYLPVLRGAGRENGLRGLAAYSATGELERAAPLQGCECWR
ncbi:hypothetical protein CSB88_4289 [Pseudomonas aeruginosa]|nr:hypothetical protein CSB88_4289 [Pseudomonas aeruginosa]